MSIICRETGITLLDDYNRIYRAIYRVSAIKREKDDGHLLISNQQPTIGEDIYRRIVANLKESIDDMTEEVFFAVDDREGYNGEWYNRIGISTDLFEPKGYQFLLYSDAKKFLPNCFRDLTYRLKDMEWLDLINSRFHY